MHPRTQVIEVWGDLACISRPELKTERFSYPVVTPSAARGIFDAIYCKPKEFRWQISKVEMLSQPSYISLRRNEVRKTVSTRNVKKWMKGTEAPKPILADLAGKSEARVQRQTMALKNVHYRLHGTIQPWPDFANRQQAFEGQFRRRAAKGKCVYQPYFGCREFPAYFRLVENGSCKPEPVDFSADLGWMLYDVFDLSRPGSSKDEPSISLFHAVVTNGIMPVPDYADDDVRKLQGGKT